MLHQIWQFLTMTNGGEPLMAIAPAIMALIMAAAATAKSEAIDKPRADRERKMQGEITKYSPWTGMQGHSVADPDSLGAGMQGFGTGMALGQNMQSADYQQSLQPMQKQLIQAQIGAYNRGMPMGDQMGSGGSWGYVPGRY